MYRRLYNISAALILFFSALPIISVQAKTSINDVIISELQTTGMNEDGNDDGREEFIEIHNQSAEEIDLTGWRIQYFSASREDVFDPLAEPTREITILDGIISAYGYALLSFEGYLEDADFYFGAGSTASSGLLAKTGGHIRIVRFDETIADVVAWGTGKSPETKAVAEIDGGSSASRIGLDETGNLLQDSDDNSQDFIISELPNPQGGSIYTPESPDETEAITPPCDGLLITEIMPNPDGIDTGNEFIEIFNPTETLVSLEDCELSTSSSKKIYRFPIGTTLDAKKFVVLSDELTGLVLANGAGGHVLLAGTTTEYLVQYPAGIAPDHTWAMFDDSWMDTDQPTPGLVNALPLPEEDTIDDQEEIAPCPDGKYRNPETNRCRNIQATAITLTPCSPGQVRNVETNRCRSLGAVVASLVPCKEGQERNPDTNRCRNVLATSTLAACQEGYERNPETNRCRKAQQSVPASTSVGSGLKEGAKRKLDGVFITAASLAVLGYGLYEYRRDVGNVVHRIRQRFAHRNTVK